MTDRRGDRSNRHPVYSHTVDQIVVTAAETSEVTTTTDANGIVGTVIVKTNDTTNNVTCDLSIRDSDGTVLYSKASIAENAKTPLDTNFLVDGTLTIGITPSGAPGTSTLTADIILMMV